MKTMVTKNDCNLNVRVQSYLFATFNVQQDYSIRIANKENCKWLIDSIKYLGLIVPLLISQYFDILKRCELSCLRFDNICCIIVITIILALSLLFVFVIAMLSLNCYDHVC